MHLSSVNAVLGRILNLPPKHRRRFRKLHAEQRKRRNVGVYSREELLDYMRKHNIRSPRKLESFRADGDPIPNSYRKEFGSWKAATREAFGNPVVKPSLDMEYMAKCALMMDVKTFAQYLDARKKNPDLIPSVYHVVRLFGSFGEFMVVVNGASFRRTLDAYGALWRRMGKAPTVADCRRAGVLLEVLVELFDRSKKKLDDWIEFGEEMWRKNERQRRSS